MISHFTKPVQITAQNSLIQNKSQKDRIKLNGMVKTEPHHPHKGNESNIFPDENKGQAPKSKKYIGRTDFKSRCCDL